MEEVENAPNRLFISYLTRLRDKSLRRNDRRSAQVYEKALASMRLYPLPLRSVQEAALIKNVGAKVLADLEACALRYGADIKSKRSSKPSRKRADKALIDVDAPSTNAAAPASAPAPAPIQKGKRARVVVQQEEADHEPVYEYRPGDKVVLVVDFRELARKRGARLKEALERTGVCFESRGLGLGDMAWIVKDSNGKERMLRHIVERKTVSDLSASIKDGRYRDQKFRLSQASLSGVVYLIEGPLLKSKQFNDKAAWSLLPADTLEAAITSTAYGSSGFMIERCADAAHTARWLKLYTEQLQQQLEQPNMHRQLLFQSHDLASFGAEHKKDAYSTVSDVFAKQLLSINGISFKKAMAVINEYPTIASLLDAYAECEGSKEKRALLEKLPLSSGRNLGPKASTAIAKALLQ